VPLGQGKVRVDAAPTYSSPVPYSLKPLYIYGKWTATYSAGRELADSSTAQLRSLGSSVTNLMTTELKFR